MKVGAIVDYYNPYECLSLIGRVVFIFKAMETPRSEDIKKYCNMTEEEVLSKGLHRPFNLDRLVIISTERECVIVPSNPFFIKGVVYTKEEKVR